MGAMETSSSTANPPLQSLVVAIEIQSVVAMIAYANTMNNANGMHIMLDFGVSQA